MEKIMEYKEKETKPHAVAVTQEWPTVKDLLNEERYVLVLFLKFSNLTI